MTIASTGIRVATTVMASTSNSIEELLQAGFRYALSLTHERATAEDLLQDACLGVSRRGGPWRRAYLLKAIRNRWIDGFRRESKVQVEPLEGYHTPVAVDPEAPQSGALDRALGHLRDEERELIYLSVVESYTAEELAEMTGKPRGTILSSLHRAKEKLRNQMPGKEEAVP